jgi:hypothetical protein
MITTSKAYLVGGGIGTLSATNHKYIWVLINSIPSLTNACKIAFNETINTAHVKFQTKSLQVQFVTLMKPYM